MGEPYGITSPKYSVSVEPSKWQFELLPAANIEGNFIVQDLQMKTQNRTEIQMNAESQFASAALPTLTGLLNSLVGIYISSGFLTQFNFSTGINDLSASQNWIGQGNFDSGFVNTKVVGGNNFNFIRSSGFYWGF